MSNSNPLPQVTQVLGSFLSILGLLGVFLYFTGWIYRWAYFGFFRLEINRLDFPLRSFLFVPIQVFCGDFFAFLRSLVAIVAVFMAIKLTVSLLKPRPGSLDNDLIVVTWLLVILFWLARNQGEIDARRDAINSTSTLPVITLVLPEKQIALGRNLDDLTLDPSLKGYRVIGDKGLFDYIRGRETNDTKLDPPRVWRLLLENKEWSYLFPALATNAKSNQRPPLLAIRQDKEGQLMILSPDYTKSK